MPLYVWNRWAGMPQTQINPWYQPATSATTTAGNPIQSVTVYTPVVSWINDTGTGPMYFANAIGEYHRLSTTTPVSSVLTGTVSPWAPYDAAQAVEAARQWRPHPRPALAAPALVRGRRALRRSLDLFRRFRPEEELRTFLRGERIDVQGRLFNYSMRKNQSLLRHTIHPGAHVPYILLIHDKITGDILASGCVVMKDTPVIDQLLAVILHIQDEESEGELVRKTNWSPPLPETMMRQLRRHRPALPLAA